MSKEFIGKRFGKLRVVAGPFKKAGKRCWEAVCSCTGERKQYYSEKKLVSKLITHCGCQAKTFVHGMSKHPLYQAWRQMIYRCYTESYRNFEYWGGRGIKVHRRYLGKSGLLNFIKDMGEKPTPDHSLDRIDPDDNYAPGNLRWATRKEQQGNLRSNVWFEYKGKRYILSDWAKIFQTGVMTLRYWINQGKPFSFIYKRFEDRINWKRVPTALAA